MGDERRQRSTRREDDIVSHEELVAEMRAVKADIEEHVHPEVCNIVDVLEGPRVQHLDGTNGPDRVKEEGIAWQVTDIRRELSNGIRLRLQARDRIYVAAIGAAAVIGAAVISAMSSG